MEELISNSSQQTENFGRIFAKKLKGGDVIFLMGEMGAGKTTFVKGLAKGIGVNSRVVSPTFVIVRKHTVSNKNSNISTLYHLDLHRLDDTKQALLVDLKDFLDDREGIVVIEWPNISQGIVKGKVWKVVFIDAGMDKRKITIQYE